MTQTVVGRTFLPLIANLIVALLLAVSFTAAASTFEISVVDNNNKPIPNAVIGIAYENTLSSHRPVLTLDVAVMDQVDFQFKPKVLVVNQRQLVDFPNSDDVRHHVYSFSSPKAFEIKMFTGSEADPVQFDKPGIVVLGCNIHDSMIGYIYVAENEHTYLSNAQGKISIDMSVFKQLAAEQLSVLNATIWHARLSATNAQRQSITLNVDENSQTIKLNILLPKDTQASPNGFRSKFRKRV